MCLRSKTLVNALTGLYLVDRNCKDPKIWPRYLANQLPDIFPRWEGHAQPQ
jgi:hypothetical protein